MTAGRLSPGGMGTSENPRFQRSSIWRGIMPGHPGRHHRPQSRGHPRPSPPTETRSRTRCRLPARPHSLARSERDRGTVHNGAVARSSSRTARCERQPPAAEATSMNGQTLTGRWREARDLTWDGSPQNKRGFCGAAPRHRHPTSPRQATTAAAINDDGCLAPPGSPLCVPPRGTRRHRPSATWPHAITRSYLNASVAALSRQDPPHPRRSWELLTRVRTRLGVTHVLPKRKRPNRQSRLSPICIGRDDWI